MTKKEQAVFDKVQNKLNQAVVAKCLQEKQLTRS